MRGRGKVTVHNKLVRDGIPAKIRMNGEEPKYRILGDYEKRFHLTAKLGEEAKEAHTAGENSQARIGELVDVAEALDELLRVHGMNWKDLRRLQAEKRRRVGGFKLGTFLETTTKP